MDKRLAFETVMHILEYLRDDQPSLSQFSRTCKKMYDASLPLLYQSPKFESFRQFELFTAILTERTGSYVRYIDLHMVPHRWDSYKINNMISSISEKTPDLELLNLELCTRLTNKALIKILQPLGQLRTLSVDQCEGIGDASVKALVERCPYIQELYLGSTHITDESLAIIASKLPLLTHLYLSGCEHITEQGVNKVILQCKGLHHIDIKDCYNVVGTIDLPRQIEPPSDHTTDTTAHFSRNGDSTATPVDYVATFDNDEWEDVDSSEDE